MDMMSERASGARICVPLCADDFEGAWQLAARAHAVADMFELRLDCFDEFARADRAPVELIQALRPFIRERTRPLILTLRPEEQGGWSHLRAEERARFWRELFARGEAPDFVDLELDLIEGLGHEAFDWSRIICSHHEFLESPIDLEALYERMARLPARLLKIAVSVTDAVECLPIFHLLARARRDGRQLIAIAMGFAGVVTRVLGPAHGAFLTYAPLIKEGATAPGQVTAAELRDLYRIDAINRETQIYGIIGSPVAYSISPQIHNRAFASRNMDAVYLPFETRDVESFIRRLVHPRTREVDWRWRGLSVTIPHKSAILNLLDSVDEAARQIGAVNTIVVEEDGLRGYNTDAEGVLAPLREAIDLKGARVAIIGAGGAARAALWAFKREGARVTLFARDLPKAQPVAREFGADLQSLAEARFASFDLVVNATPLGARGANEGRTPATAEQLRGAGIAYDLVYNPSETLFLREARQAGCRTIGGLSMLVAQATRQFELWTGEEAPVDLMLEVATRALEKN